MAVLFLLHALDGGTRSVHAAGDKEHRVDLGMFLQHCLCDEVRFHFIVHIFRYGGDGHPGHIPDIILEPPDPVGVGFRFEKTCDDADITGAVRYHLHQIGRRLSA